jgi:hypothetical protein
VKAPDFPAARGDIATWVPEWTQTKSESQRFAEVCRQNLVNKAFSDFHQSEWREKLGDVPPVLRQVFDDFRISRQNNGNF